MSVFVVHFSWSDDAPSLKIAFWNVENLFDLIDDPKINDDEFAVGGKKYVTKEIYELKLKVNMNEYVNNKLKEQYCAYLISTPSISNYTKYLKDCKDWEKDNK